MIIIKTPEEIAVMREGGHRLAEILRYLVSLVKPGATTAEIDAEAEKRIRAAGGEPAFKGYRAFGISTPFPGSVCTSINDEIVHGLPYPARQLREGDVVSLDIGMKYKGYYTDTAHTIGLEYLSDANKKLISTAQKSLQSVIEYLQENLGQGQLSTADIGAFVQDYVEGAGFNVVRELVGHGVGKQLHEDPSVPNYRMRNAGEPLRPGLVIAIEPMIYAGTPGVSFQKDGWQFVTTHGAAAAHFEHTVAITKEGISVLTA